MIDAWFFDGRDARRHRVRIDLDARGLRIVGDGFDWHVPRDRLEIGERLGSAPRLIRLGDDACCEVPDGDALAALLAAAGHRDGAVDRAQRAWSVALGALGVLLAVLALGYFVGLPWLSREVAQRLPDPARSALSTQTLEFLDHWALQPSALPAARQDALRAGLSRLQPPDGVAVPVRLEFRKGEGLPNAFALPDGTLVLLDELVALAADDEQLLAVLAHEIGHVRHQHGVQLLVHGTAIGALSAWWFGDISSLLASAPTALSQAQNSRAFEREADAYAAATLRASGIAPVRLAEILEKLVAAAPHDGDSALAGFLASHPAPRERIEALRGAR